jgi:hypothetical protein
MENNNRTPPGEKATYSSPGDNRFIDQIRSNVKSDLIEITSDKLENILLKHLERMGLKRSWITPCTLLVTAILAVTTASFSKRFGIEGSVWQAFFVLIALIALVWLIVVIIRIIYCWNKCSIEYLIDLVKNAEKDSQQ